MTTIITDTGPHYSGSAQCDGDDLWVTGYEMANATGWALREEGLCQGDVCVPVPSEVVRGSRINVAALWRRLGWPVERAGQLDTWVLCTGTDARRIALDRGQAPDFELADVDGRIHRLADYRGRKVLLLTWASWCRCREELGQWQVLHEELADQGLTVLVVAMDGRGVSAVRPWLAAAGASFPALVDVDHRLSALFHFVNVPQAVWIDEDGAIVRPTEPAGATDAFRAADRRSGELPAEARRAESAAWAIYADAVRDWVAKGEDSAFVATADRVAALADATTDDAMRAHALFKLARFLLAQNHRKQAFSYFDQACRLHPESWLMWRQVKEFETPGGAMGAEFWARVDALGSARYFPRVDIDGMP